jgi:large subunit ribosomal protein L28
LLSQIKAFPLQPDFRKRKNTMSKICQITGKKALVGNNVSHSKRRTKKKFNVNLFHKRFYLPEEDKWVRLRVSASGLRLINKIGIKAAMTGAKENGLL